MSTNIPADLRYSKSDEWVRSEGDELVIGITDYAQDALGDIVYLELPEVGATLKPGDSFGAIESVVTSDFSTEFVTRSTAGSDSTPWLI